MKNMKESFVIIIITWLIGPHFIDSENFKPLGCVSSELSSNVDYLETWAIKFIIRVLQIEDPGITNSLRR